MPVRKLLLCMFIGLFSASSLPAWAETEADQVARAKQFLDSGKYAEGIAILAPIVSSAATASQEAREMLAGCYRMAGEPRNAIPILEAVIRDYPQDRARSAWRLGRCYLAIGEYAKAITVMRDGLQCTPRPFDATRNLTANLARAYGQTKEWDDAISFYQSLLEKQPKEVAHWYLQLGWCYRNQGKMTEAVAALEKAYEAAKGGDPKTVKEITKELHSAYIEAGQASKAKALLEKPPQDYPGDWRLDLQDTLCKENGASEAIKVAYITQNERQYEKAIPIFRDVIARYPDCPNLVESAHVCMIECLCSLSKFDEASAYAKKLYDEQPAMRAGALLGQGWVSFTRGRWDDATADFRRVIAEYPKDKHVVLARMFLATALSKAGRIDEAVDVLKVNASGDFAPSRRAAAFLQIGAVYQDAKRYRDAINAFKEVRNLKEAPDEMGAEATYRCGSCYHAIQYNTSAIKCMREAMTRWSDTRWAAKANADLHLWCVDASADQDRM